jgi:hypothetical protein
MILNSYAVLTAFVAAVRVLLALAVLGLALGEVRAWRRRLSWPRDVANEQDVAEQHSYLVFLLVILLVALNLVSWPLLYLLLQSYVPAWPGVMCIYGVTQVGAGSIGPSGWLPTLLGVLEWSKPALVFAGGAWFVLYALNRQTVSGALLPRLFAALPVVAVLALADAAVELTYLVIPKIDVLPSSGCCTTLTGDGWTSWFTAGSDVETGRPWLWLAYYGGNLALIAALFGTAFGRGVIPGGWRLAGLLAGGLAVAVVSGVFLAEVAAPTLLRLPFHRCVYDLVPQAPEAILAVGLFVAGCFLLGWAGVAYVWGRTPETGQLVDDAVRRMLRLSAWTLLAWLLMLSLEMGLASGPDEASRCAWDGLPVQPLYRVRVVDATDTSREFCCVRCAAAWLTEHGEAHTVYVTDEAGGSEIDARAAYFVQSAVPTNPITRNSIHAFRERSDAQEHAAAYGGRLLTADEQPFDSGSTAQGP